MTGNLPSFLDQDSTEETSSETQPVFVAREREISFLNTFLEKINSGSGQVVLISGGAGRGKTALIEAFARQTLEKHPDYLVAFGKCNAQSGLGDPYLPFREALDMLTGGVESAWSTGKISTETAILLWTSMPQIIQTILEVGPDLVDKLIPANKLQNRVAATGGEGLVSELEEFLKHKTIFQTSPSVKQLDLFDQHTRVLRQIAEGHPLLLILDDLQWADDASISFFFHLVRRIEDRPILILCAYRPGEVAQGRDGDRHPLDQVINEIKRIYGNVSLDLSQSESEAGMEFINAFLDSEPNKLGDDFRQALFEHTGGHPLFTIELLRAMQERGDLIRDKDQNWIEEEHLDWNRLPARVEAVIEERFARLEEEIRDLLSVASVEGKDFTAQVLARIQKIEERKLLSELSQVLSKRHRLVHELGEIELGQQILSKYQFAHHLFQRYLYNSLSSGEKRLLHGEITQVLEEIFGPEANKYAVQLAYHSQQGNLKKKAVHYLRLAGDEARASYANQEALRYYTDLLNLLPPDSQERFQVLKLRGKVYDVLAQRQAQLADAEEMLKIAQIRKDESLQFDGLVALTDAHIETEHVLAEEPANNALKLAQKLGDPIREASAFQRLGWSAWLKGDYSKSRQYLEEAVNRFQKNHVLDKAASCLHILSLALGALHEDSKAMDAVQEAVELSRKIGNKRLEATSLRRLAIAHIHQQQHQEALPIAKQALALHREVGDWSEEAHALNVLGLIYGWLDQWDELEVMVRESLRIGHELRATTTVQFATWNLATSHFWRRGRYEEAIQLMNQELEWALGAEDGWLIGTLNHYKGWFLDEIGQTGAALKAFQTALAALQELSSEGPWYINTLSRIGYMYSKQGKHDLAQEYSDQVKDLADRFLKPRDRIHVVINRGKVALLLGEEEILQQANRALDLSLDIVLDSSHDYDAIEELLVTSAKVRLKQGDVDGAYERTSKLAALLEFVPVHPALQDYAFTHAQVLQAIGKPEKAKSYLKKALDWINLVAGNMKNETWRQAWLEDNRRNKEIIEVAAEWGIS